MLVDIVFVAGAYLFGSLPVLYWIGMLKGFDLRQEDDMHQALWRKVGFIEGSAGVLWDIFKGPIPPLIARWLGFDILIVGLSGLAVVAGQMWPIFLRFDSGEKGNTTGLGVTLAISPPTLAIAAIPIIIGALWRIISSMRGSAATTTERLKFSGVSDAMPLGMLIGFASLSPAAWLLREDPMVVWTFIGLFALLVVRRLTAKLRQDLKSDPRANTASILKNRFLYDRSYH